MTVTTPTIVAGTGKVFSSSGTTTLTLYGVKKETVSKNANFVETAMPTKDSDKKIMMDYMGVSRIISIEGKVTSSDVASLYRYENDLVGLNSSADNGGNTSLIFGTQGSNPAGVQVGYKYYPEGLNYSRSTNIYITVYVDSVTATRNEGDPESIDYEITLFECNSTTSK